MPITWAGPLRNSHCGTGQNNYFLYNKQPNKSGEKYVKKKIGDNNIF